jgi:aldehyde dehydrogenase (NAD+)
MASRELGRFYISGAWVDPAPGAARLGIENPATEEIVGEVALGTAADIDRAVGAARAAFPGFAAWSAADRLALLRRILEIYRARIDEFAEAIRIEMGAPAAFAREAQAWAGEAHIEATIAAAERFEWETRRGSTILLREGIGVCGLITPWNWPMNQIACKVAPAIVAGCTMVLKPSEIAPLSGALFAEVMDAAGVPAGVFNLVNGTGPEAGQALAAHPSVDMMSFTGSTRGGVAVALAAAPTVKRVCQELGGKSPNILLPGCDIVAEVAAGTEACLANTGQSCDAPTRMLVPRARHAEALEIARASAEAAVTGDPTDPATTLGPVVSRIHYDRIQALIEKGIAEGATLVAGGPGKPKELNAGHFVRPTVFGGVRNDMTIAREEIFGPVLSILPYESVEEAVAIANDTPYGLAAYVQGPEDEALAVARRLRAGQVSINRPDWDLFAPFGGYKQSGNGREYADWGIHDFCEIKAMIRRPG